MSIAETLKVTLVQTTLAWHAAAANRAHFDRLLTPLKNASDVIVLPEMFSTGFTMSPQQVAEPVDGPTTHWLRERAASLNTVITGSVVTEDRGHYFNRLLWMRPDGSYVSYDKRHLFRMAGEHEHYRAGGDSPIVEVAGWRVRPLICYDLRFPVWSRNRIGTADSYDVLIYVANWPERRRYAWQTLLRARAIENLSYCIGVNRIGRDGTDINYSGDSAALDFLGQPLSPLNEDSAGEFVTTVELKRTALQDYRQKFPAHRDADDFQIQP